MKTNRMIIQSCSGNPTPRINQIISQFDEMASETNIKKLTFLSSADHPMLMEEYSEFAFHFPFFRASGSAFLQFETNASMGKDLRVVIE
jgi:hypothetical protein